MPATAPLPPSSRGASAQRAIAIGAALLLLALCPPILPWSPAVPSAARANAPDSLQRRAQAMTAVTYAPVPFTAIEGWAADDHRAALDAFLKSCARIAGRRARAAAPASATGAETGAESSLAAACEAAAALARGPVDRAAARRFFETHFEPQRVVHPAGVGMVTGYYEPVVEGSRKPGGRYTAPLLRRPADLVNVVAETERGAKADKATHLRRLPDGRLVPYPTRREIESGALDDQALEFLYLSDPVDVFFMQVQGSGRVVLDDGSTVRVTYDGKNGHPYTSVGRHLIDSGQFAAEQVSLQSLERWLKADRQRGREAMWVNKSYVFFRELAGAEAAGPLGAMRIPLSEGRSLAVDTAHHALGLPVWVASPTLTHATAREGERRGFHRLMVAQDVGSAIRGPERGDIYFGSGAAAGKLAGVTKHPANFIVLLPKSGAGGGIDAARGRPAERTAGP